MHETTLRIAYLIGEHADFGCGYCSINEFEKCTVSFYVGTCPCWETTIQLDTQSAVSPKEPLEYGQELKITIQVSYLNNSVEQSPSSEAGSSPGKN
jgi:hypothetical protein